MVKLIPRCFAANNETLYFLARTTQKTKYGVHELAVLVKSDPFPASIHDAKWTVVSTYNTYNFSGLGDIFGDSGDLSCTVNDSGVFVFTGPYNGNRRRSYRYYPNNSTGECSGSPFLVEYKFQQPTNVSVVVTPRIRVGYGSNDINGPRGSWYWTTSSRLTKTNGTSVSVRYGDEKLYVVMETGSPYYVSLNNVAYPRYHRTLAVYPFTVPYYLGWFPISNLTTPWNLNCYEDEMQTWAVFGDMVYYSCRDDNGTALTGHLYTYDSTKNLTLGPVDTDVACTGRRSLTLVPGKPGLPSPAYGLVSTSTMYAQLDLTPENYGRCTSFQNDGSTSFQVNACFGTSCTNTAAIIGGVVGGVALLLICIALALFHRRRTKKKKQQEADAPVMSHAQD
ncbi:hypothetical protein BGZ93_006692 [Podila epicladia]|nr:hypothetical protein BGZ92_003105 [Podila epicladia]KAG0094849.1 hypothetical protein BGZ93_006692 [Podila epicladia]